MALKADRIFGQLIFIAGLLLSFAGPLLFVWMCWHWLKTGVWPDWSPAALGFEPPTTKMLGLRKLLSWTWSQQSALLLFLVGIGVAWLGGNVSDDNT
jgi:hypothetical protein